MDSQMDLNGELSDYLLPGHSGYYTVTRIPAGLYEIPLRIALNSASDHDLEVFEHALRHDRDFLKYVKDQRDQWEKLGIEAMKEEARLKNACSRVLDGRGSFLPPKGPLLLLTDKPPQKETVPYDPRGTQIEEIRLRRSEAHKEECYYRKRLPQARWAPSISPKDDAAVTAARHRVRFLMSAAKCEQAGHGQAGLGQPSPGQPVYAQPIYGQPIHAQPIYGQPVYGQPVYGQPIYGQPIYGQPIYGQPLCGQPGRGQPGHGQPDRGKPGHGQPGHGQPGRGQPDREKPEREKPGRGHPGRKGGAVRGT